MKFWITLGFLLTVISIGNAQQLPAEWQGLWKGKVEIWSQNQLRDAFPMTLEIVPLDSSLTFVITYKSDSDTPDRREYELVSIDTSIGHYAVDEHNSIILDNYLNGNCLHSRFSVMQSDIHTRMCLRDGQMEYELTSYTVSPIRLSGDSITEGDTIPAVESYRLYQFMKASLSRQP